MLKRILYFLLPIPIVVIALAFLILFDDSPEQQVSVPSAPGVNCPLRLSPRVAALIADDHLVDWWSIYRFDGTTRAPSVAVGITEDEVPDSSVEASCVLRIRSAPETPGTGVDWRMGHTIQNADQLRGKKMVFRVRVKSDRKVSFDRGAVYMYDGEGPPPGKTLGDVVDNWKTFKIRHKVADDAEFLELWIRLLIDTGTIVPGKATLFFDAELDLDE